MSLLHRTVHRFALMASSAAALSKLLARQGLPAWRCAFGYGSGVVAQANAGGAQPMVDAILCVDDARAWHASNLAANASHYSWLGACGAAAVAGVQGGGVYFNTLVPVAGEPGRLMKYGVVSSAALERDLRRWSSLYLAGRLQKPVVWVDAPDGPLEAALEANLRAALAAALLALPETFDERALFAAIGNLSYAGDVRFLLGSEDPKKVANIVAGAGNLERFRALYAGDVAAAAGAGALRVDGDGSFTQPRDNADWCLSRLPDAARAGVRGGDAKQAVAERLATTVFWSSAAQTAKGLATAGAAKAAAYALEKRRKGRKGS